MNAQWMPLLVHSQDYLEMAELVLARAAARGVDLPVEKPGPPPALTVRDGVPDHPGGATAAESFAAALEARATELSPWEVEDLRRLASSEFATARRWAMAMDVCSDHIDEWLSTEQVAAESGMTINEWRDAPRKIKRHMARHYPAAPGLPLRDVWGGAVGAEGQIYWSITPEQALRWRQARG